MARMGTETSHKSHFKKWVPLSVRLVWFGMFILYIIFKNLLSVKKKKKGYNNMQVRNIEGLGYGMGYFISIRQIYKIIHVS